MSTSRLVITSSLSKTNAN
jgi:translation initiation factor 3 subunit C